MFIRPITVNKNGKRHGYWALVESYRTSRGPRQRVVSYLGQADEPLRNGMHQKAGGTPYRRMLFDDVGLFETNVIKTADGTAKLLWHKVEAWRNWAALSEGCCLLRTNINDRSGEELWKAYMQLTEAEAAFRIHKSDLKIRPVRHHKTERVEAHILVCFLAYVLWKTLGQLCKAAGLGDEPRRVFEEPAKIKAVDVVLPTRTGHLIRRRCVSQPTDYQAILLQRLGLNLPGTMPLEDKILKKM